MIVYILQYKNGSVGRLISIDTHIYSTVKSVKKLIKQLYRIPVCKQSLFLNDINLYNKFTLHSYSISSDSTLYLVTHSFLSFSFYRNLFN